jgi:hypothetical protein
MRACTYCGSDVDAHDPLVVDEGDADGPLAGQFCNYGCLVAHVEDADLLTDTACAWEPGETT